MNIYPENGIATIPAGTTYNRDVIRNGAFLGTTDSVTTHPMKVRVISHDREADTALASRVLCGTGQFIRLEGVRVFA